MLRKGKRKRKKLEKKKKVSANDGKCFASSWGSSPTTLPAIYLHN